MSLTPDQFLYLQKTMRTLLEARQTVSREEAIYNLLTQQSDMSRIDAESRILAAAKQTVLGLEESYLESMQMMGLDPTRRFNFKGIIDVDYLGMSPEQAAEIERLRHQRPAPTEGQQHEKVDLGYPIEEALNADDLPSP